MDSEALLEPMLLIVLLALFPLIWWWLRARVGARDLQPPRGSFRANRSFESK